MESVMVEIKEHMPDLLDIPKLPNLPSLPDVPVVGSIIEAVQEVVEEVTEELESKHEELRSSHLKLQHSIATGVKRKLKIVDVEFAVMKEYTMKSLITVAAWILSQSCNLTIFRLLYGTTDQSSEEPIDMLLSRGIYLAASCFFVPVLGWALRFFDTSSGKDKDASLLQAQVMLIRGALPMVFAWSSKDFLGSIENLHDDGGSLWFIFVVAVGATVFVGASATLRTLEFNRGRRESGVGFHSRDILKRFLALPCQASLAVGFAWNEVIVWFSKKVQADVKAPLFKMMVQIVYFVIVSMGITAWTLHHHIKKLEKQKEEEEAAAAAAVADVPTTPMAPATTAATTPKSQVGMESHEQHELHPEVLGAPVPGSSPSSSSSKPAAAAAAAAAAAEVGTPNSATAAKAKASTKTLRTTGSTSTSASQATGSSLTTSRQGRNAEPGPQPSLPKTISTTSAFSIGTDMISHLSDVDDIALWAAARLSASIQEVFVDALGFVYAWALLDSLNAFFFVYLGGYESISESPFQLVLAFAIVLTALSTRYATVLIVEHRISAWNQTSSLLIQKAMTLNVGWAWANYCGVAISNAVEENPSISPLALYWACAGFCWLVVTVACQRFEIEHRAWERNTKQETLKSTLVEFLPPPAREELVERAERRDEKIEALVHDGTTGKALLNGNLDATDSIKPSNGSPIAGSMLNEGHPPLTDAIPSEGHVPIAPSVQRTIAPSILGIQTRQAPVLAGRL